MSLVSNRKNVPCIICKEILTVDELPKCRWVYQNQNKIQNQSQNQDHKNLIVQYIERCFVCRECFCSNCGSMTSSDPHDLDIVSPTCNDCNNN